AAVLFAFDPPLAHSLARPGRAARDGRDGSLADQIHQTLAGIFPIAFLSAVALGGDHEHALAGEPPASQAFQAPADVGRQRGRAANVEAELHGARKLVDVLPSGSGGANELLLELAFLDVDPVVDAEHGSWTRIRGTLKGPILSWWQPAADPQPSPKAQA